MTNATVKKSKPKLEFFSKRVFLVTALIGGGAWYWFSLRPYFKKKKHLELEAHAKEFLRLQELQKERESQDK